MCVTFDQYSVTWPEPSSHSCLCHVISLRYYVVKSISIILAVYSLRKIRKYVCLTRQTQDNTDEVLRSMLPDHAPVLSTLLVPRLDDPSVARASERAACGRGPAPPHGWASDQ